MRDSGAIHPTFDQLKKIITKDLENLNLNILEVPMSRTDSIAESDASAASSGGKWELT